MMAKQGAKTNAVQQAQDTKERPGGDFSLPGRSTGHSSEPNQPIPTSFSKSTSKPEP